MKVRAVPAIDTLDRDDERLVLVSDRAFRLVGLAPAILDLSAEWCTLDTLTTELEQLFGVPADASAEELARTAVHDLLAQGLVEIDETEDA